MNKTLTLTLVLAGVLGFSTSLFGKTKRYTKKSAVKHYASKKAFKKVAVLTPSQKTFKKKTVKYKKPITKAQLKARKKVLKKRRLAKLNKRKRILKAKKKSKWDRIDFYLLNMGHQENGGDIFQ